MADIDIITIDDAQIYLQNSSNSSQLQTVLTALSRAFSAMVGYQIISKEYTDQVLSGGGTSLLRFPAMNVTACSKISYRSGRSSDGTVLWTELDATNWELDYINKLGIVGYEGYIFGRGTQNYQASYTAGWALADVPGIIIEQFVAELNRWMERRHDLQTRSISGNADATFSYRDLSAETRRVLQAYARIGI